ncbi:protein crumbs homolog 3 isoform X1 [Castor canadensis]|uniref:Protein crumbs homolog 3 isoform X1 n=1 Tax=Castor canadensis TaxID=51338 RepID=A0AC58L055_CASCN
MPWQREREQRGLQEAAPQSGGGTTRLMRQEPFLQCFKEGGQGTSPPSFNQLTSQQDAQGHNRCASIQYTPNGRDSMQMSPCAGGVAPPPSAPPSHLGSGAQAGSALPSQVPGHRYPGPKMR